MVEIMDKFKIDQRVVIINHSKLSGKAGVIVGQEEVRYRIYFYIVLLDVPGEWKAYSIPEKCLELEKEMNIDQFIENMEKF